MVIFFGLSKADHVLKHTILLSKLDIYTISGAAMYGLKHIYKMKNNLWK
jgi:fumarate reductase subunit D